MSTLLGGAASLSSAASSGSSSSGSSSGAGSCNDDDIPAASTTSASNPAGLDSNMTDGITPTSVEAESSSTSTSSSSSGEMIELPKSKLKLQGKALDKYKSMNPKMQELALEYCDSIVLQYVNGGQRKIQKEEAFLLKRLRDFGVYHHRSTSTGSLPTTKTPPGVTVTTSQSNGSSSNKKAALSNPSNNTTDATNANQGGKGGEGGGQQQPHQQQSSQPQVGEQTTGSQDFVLLPKSKMKIQGRALDRYLAMPLDMRIKALEYCDTHMIQRRRGGGGTGPPAGSSSSYPNSGVPPIKDEVAYMDKRLKDFAAANDLPQHQQRLQQKQSNKNSKTSSTTTKEQQLPLSTTPSPSIASTAFGPAHVPPASTNSTISSIAAANINTSTEVIVSIIDGDEVVELPKSKVRIRDNTLKRLRVMPQELQIRAIDYCDNIIVARKDTPDYIVNEQGFVATVIESFIKKWHNDEQKQPRGGGQQYKKKQQQQQGATRTISPSSPTTPSSRAGGGGGGPSNSNINETNTNAISSSSNSSLATPTTSATAVGSALSPATDGDIPPLQLPRSKLQVTGNPLQILCSLKDDQLRQQTIEYCDDVFMKKLQDKKSRPIENEMAYLASIIDAFLLNAQTMTTGIPEINGTHATSGGQQPQQDQNKNGRKETSSTSTSSATTPTTTITTTLVELPVSKMKVIGHALQKLKSLPPPLLARAIQFCDQVLLRRENKSNKRKSRPIINETGYLASLIDNFLETQCTKEELASVSTYQKLQQASSNNKSAPATPSSTTTMTGNGSMGTSNPPSSSSAPATDDPASYSTLIATLKQELEATKSKLDDKENETRDMSSKLQELQSTASSTTAKLRQETKNTTNLLKDELTAAKAEAQKLQEMVKEFKATMSLKDEEIAKLSNEKTKLEEEASKMTETFSSMTKALVSTQEEKQEAIKTRDESEAKLSAKELELEKIQSALKSAESKLADEQWKVEQLKQSEKKNAASRNSNEKQAMEKSRFLNFGGHHHQDISMFGTTAGVGGGDDDDDADITEDEIPFDFSKIFDDENPLGLATDFQHPSSSTSTAAHSFHGSDNNGHQHLTPTKGRDQL